MRSSTEIQTELDEAREARRKAMFAQSYTLDDGQGKQTVERADLTQLNKLIRSLENELEAALDDESGGGGIISGDFRRY